MFLARNKRLLAAFKLGERWALDEVYRNYASGVRAFLCKGFSFRSGKGHYYFKGIHNPNELEAAVQEVFRRAFEDKARTSYNGVSSFTNWVLAIGRNMVINQFRNREISFSEYVSRSDQRSMLAVIDDEVTEEFSGVLYGQSTPSQQSSLEHDELKGLMAKFMKQLTKHDRELLVLRFAEGYGQEEAARILKSTRMKVRTAEAKLRSRLRAFLRHSGYIDHIP